MRVILLCLSLVYSLVWTMSVDAAEYVIDSRGAHASIVFKFKHIGISWLTGQFKSFNGTFTYDQNDPGASKIVVEIDPASLDSNHAERDKHIRGEDYLNVARYPQARFESTRIEPLGEGKATVYGNLTLHGQTREIAIDANLTGQGNDPWGGYRVGLEGFTVLSTTDFGFKMPPTNEVHLELYLEGVRR
ncbi:MAG: YceI family protein [Pseudomonadales bacterium]